MQLLYMVVADIVQVFLQVLHFKAELFFAYRFVNFQIIRQQHDLIFFAGTDQFHNIGRQHRIDGLIFLSFYEIVDTAIELFTELDLYINRDTGHTPFDLGDMLGCGADQISQFCLSKMMFFTKLCNPFANSFICNLIIQYDYHLAV